MYRNHFLELVACYGVEKIAEILSPHLLDRRKARIEKMLEARLGSIEVAIEAPADPYNALAVMRSAEALGVTKVHLIEAKVRRRGRATMGTHRWMDCKKAATTENFFESTKNKKVFAADGSGEITPEEIPVHEPLILLFGNEHEGVSKEALKRADATFKIPMYGMVESYNLSVAAGITLYQVTESRRKLLGCLGDLSAKEKVFERAYGYYQTVGKEVSEKILHRCLA